MPNVKPLLSVSILNLDFSCLERSVKTIESAGIDSWHIDVMDGHFVNNISFGPFMVGVMKKLTCLPVVAHLMIEKPEKYFKNFYEEGADDIILHVETINSKNEDLLDYDNVGLSLNPDISIELLKPYLQKLNRVLVMSVMAGFGGQKFIADSLDKISALKHEKDLNKFNYIISVDGGIDPDTAKQSLIAGVNELSVGSYITSASDPKQAINKLIYGQ